jgi:CHASE3 domain sensor protein
MEKENELQWSISTIIAMISIVLVMVLGVTCLNLYDNNEKLERKIRENRSYIDNLDSLRSNHYKRAQIAEQTIRLMFINGFNSYPEPLQKLTMLIMHGEYQKAEKYVDELVLEEQIRNAEEEALRMRMKIKKP